MSFVIGVHPLPSPDPMLSAVVQRIHSAIDQQVHNVHQCESALQLAHRLHHFAQLLERHRTTLEATSSLLRDVPQLDAREDANGHLS